MSNILRYDDDDTVEVNFNHIIFKNDKSVPFVDTCFIPIEQWETVKNFIDSQIKLKKDATKRQTNY